MSDQYELIVNILIFMKLILLILLIILACGYALPLSILSRFHSSINIMTIHVCLTFIGSAIFWIIIYMLDLKQAIKTEIITQRHCSILSSIETIFNCLVIYSLCTVSINRLCTINYSNKTIFKSRRWAFICIGITWLITLFVTSLLLISPDKQNCFQLFGNIYILEIYVLLIVVLFPTIIFVIINILLFEYIRQSSRRIQPAISSTRVISNNRDIRLLKHMVIIFVIFLSGWSPIYILVCIDFNSEISPIIYRFLSILPALSLLCDIIDLFLFNHQLRSYFRQLMIIRNNRIRSRIINHS